MLYQIYNGLVRYGAATILENIYFEIRNTEKIAVVGRNGCGKTTLFKLIAGMITLDTKSSDEKSGFHTEGKPVIGFLQQMSFDNETITVEEELLKAFADLLGLQKKLNELCTQMELNHTKEIMDRYANTLERFEYNGGYTYRSELETLITRFGFALTDLQRPINQFSGGQKTKLAFIKLLLSKPDIMLLDEPTNHLDISTIEWLEGYLKQYPKAVVIISHDRMFLDKVTDVTYEIEYGQITRYQGNYTDFVKQKRLNWDKQQKDYLLQQKEINRLTTIIEQYKNHPTKAAMTRSKLKQIEHMNIIEAPPKYDLRSIHANFEPKRAGGNTVLKADKLVIGYDKPLSEVSFELKKGQKLAVLGENGIGKSTLLKTLVGQCTQLSGEYRYGFQIDTGYYDQELAQISNDRTVLEEFCEEFPDMLLTEARTALGCFLFTQDTVYKKVCQLSGGEKVRLCLAKLLKKRPNLLLLDEPTNHMDIVGKEALETMLSSFSGTILVVSHDRYFIQKIADSLLVFEKDGVHYYPFGYREFVDRENGINITDEKDTPLIPENTSIMAANKKLQRKGSDISFIKSSTNNKQTISRLEVRIEETEKEIAAINRALQKPEIACDYIQLTDLTEQLLVEEGKLEDYYKQYEQLFC